MNARILIAAGSKTLASFIRQALEDLGAELEVVVDGNGAQAAAKARLPDLLVVDQSLPGLDGYAVAYALKQLAAQRPGVRVPRVLLIVPDHASPDPERLAYVGITDVLARPFERAVLLERAKALIDQRDGQHGARDGRDTREVPRVSLLEGSSARGVQPAPALGTGTPTSSDPIDPGGPIGALIEQKLAQLLANKLPALLEGAVARLLPAQVEEAIQAAVAQRVPQAVEGSIRTALAELAHPTRIGELARQAIEPALQAEMARLGSGIRGRIESDLLARLETFVQQELPQRLVQHGETIIWKVVPALAEDLVREEIRRLTQP